MQLLDILLKLIDLVDKLLLVSLVLLSVLAYLLSSLRDCHLKLLPVALTVVDDCHVLRLVLLEIIEHFKFLIQSDQSVKGVLKLYILLFKGTL